jgi:hypothetical protein
MINIYDELFWKIPSRIAGMYRDKSRIVDEIADIIPLVAVKFEKAKEELSIAQEYFDTENKNKEKLEMSAKELGYTIDWNKKAIVKE